jgi:DNA-binding CsgD family transcriptional regulator
LGLPSAHQPEPSTDPVALTPPAADARAGQMLALLDAAGLRHVSLAGVSRPQRADELESFFVLISREPLPAPLLGLLTPLLHACWRRVMAQEFQLLQGHAVRAASSTQGVTARERQVLAWMRQGKSNQEIGLLLGISALTVKNHVQKILRKLSASNRAQAVAQAMSLQLLNECGGR